MSRPVVFMFSGQGSHYYQMGRELFSADAVFRQALLELDAVATASLGRSVVEHIYEDFRRKSDMLDRTVLTHPAIFMLECALTKTLVARGVESDYVLGASLGTYVAAVAANVISAEEGLRAVIRQAQIIEDCVPRGGMLVVLGDSTLYSQLAQLHTDSDLAAVNFDQHFVVSATSERLDSIERFLLERGIHCQRLAVGHPFHSRWMVPAQQRCRDVLERMQYRQPTKPVVCCAQPALVDRVDAETLWRAGHEPIRLRDAVRLMEARGSHIYLDVGPSGTLATLLKYNIGAASSSIAIPMLTPFGEDVNRVAQAVARLQDAAQ